MLMMYSKREEQKGRQRMREEAAAMQVEAGKTYLDHKK
jgi:hypothetical protein